MENEKKHIEIRSNEVQEILGGVPSRIVRYGILTIFVVFVLLLVFSWLFQYPDVISSKVVVTTERPPATIVARATGQIKELFVSDTQHVSSGEVIAIIENPGIYEDVLQLNQLIPSIQQFLIDYNISEKIDFPKNLQLGPIQEEYSLFIKKYNDYQSFLDLDYFPRINKSLEDQKRMSRIYYDRLWTQRQIMDKDYQLALSKYKRDSALHKNQVLSLQDLEKSESEMLNKKYDFEQVRTSLAEMQMDLLAVDQRIIENEKNHRDQKTQLQLEVSEAYSNLSGVIKQWELTYILKAPIEGNVSFNAYWSENQNVREGDKVLTIIPNDAGELIGRTKLSVLRSGKVNKGQDVNIKFDNYPYMEFGMVKGTIKTISAIPEDDYYTVELSFPNGLVTNYGKSLELQNEITGVAEIITQELRLIQRFLNPLKALWKERIETKE